MELTIAPLEAGFTRRAMCRICESGDLELVLDYGRMPLAGGFVKADDPRANEKFPLALARCRRCTLLQVLDDVAPERIFSQYSYASSYNRTLVAHFAEVARELQGMAGREGLIVEFGCNDGVLMNPLQAMGCRVVGVDPSDVAAKAAAERGWPLVQGYFDEATARTILHEHGRAKIIAASNVCAHVQDPNVLIRGVTELLADDGRFVFEVHYQGDLMEWNQYDTVYHEHTCYYSLTSLAHLLDCHGMRIIDVRRIPIHSGSIHVVACRQQSPLRENRSTIGEMLAREAGWDTLGFAERVRSRRDCLAKLTHDLAKAGKRITAYGASGRATMLLNFCELGPDVVENVSDLSPLRYGRVVPGVKVPVVPRQQFHERPPDYCIITAWNYEAEIVADESAYLANGGIMIVPLPNVRLTGRA